MFRFYIIIPLILSFGCASSDETLISRSPPYY